MGGNVSTEQRVLDVVLSFAEVDTLPDLLRHTVESACDLIGAPYGALAVINGHKELTEFTAHHDGQVQITSGDPRSIGLADFLGAPIKVHDETFGNLFLSGKAEFTNQDRDILTALATAAGSAVEHLDRYEQTRKREVWLRAAAEVTTNLLMGTDGRDALYLVAKTARTTANADFAAVVLPDHTGDLVIEVTDGGTYDAEGMWVPKEGTVTYRVYESGQGECHAEGKVPAVPGPCAVVPLKVGKRTIGVLILSRSSTEPGFDDPDLIEAFAAQAALVLEFTRARGDTERLAVLEDRDRIARDLHDLVIQRLFGLGLGLQGLTGTSVRPQVSERISGFVEEVDRTIREIRRTIFSLQEPPAGGTSLRGQLLNVVHESARLLGFEPDVSLEGPLDTVVPDQVRPDLLATLREALTNVVRHARAKHVAVAVSVDRTVTSVELMVKDDGSGLPLADDSGGASHHAGGLANMAARARRHHGDCAVDSIPGAGVSITWFVPLVLQEARWR
ncbi:Histidine kinase-, DNA gyrase B-, and HSP90-like ATPase [Lentzea waywayandensis]|uniref:Histidine kinase-, DNA gyrase B-, and HSP90-like ATPase n=1 Tax=Lentzea waywayandensis TaxID=84724 RepID=A0A1I6E3J4_9PSEU|nr:GAF domain-containing protein [Lentzea waywayandensis]SFR12112.1 Histidine kinase-, DNA gyrase B-, and HSP90-like ATPase [Lentzea waywayandensis]